MGLVVYLLRVFIWSGKVIVCLFIELALFILSGRTAVAAVLFISAGRTAVTAVLLSIKFLEILLTFQSVGYYDHQTISIDIILITTLFSQSVVIVREGNRINTLNEDRCTTGYWAAWVYAESSALNWVPSNC